MNEIDNITLNCFANKQQYEHVMKKNDFHNDKQFLSDKKFYKKRVIDLTKKLFRNDVDDLQLYNTFDSYTKSCINYLKFFKKFFINLAIYSSLIYLIFYIAFDEVTASIVYIISILIPLPYMVYKGNKFKIKK